MRLEQSMLSGSGTVAQVLEYQIVSCGLGAIRVIREVFAVRMSSTRHSMRVFDLAQLSKYIREISGAASHRETNLPSGTLCLKVTLVWVCCIPAEWDAVNMRRIIVTFNVGSRHSGPL